MQHFVDLNRKVGVFLAFKDSLEEIARDATMMYQALGMLRQGVVSTQLVNFAQLEKSFEEVRDSNRIVGYLRLPRAEV